VQSHRFGFANKAQTSVELLENILYEALKSQIHFESVHSDGVCKVTESQK